jgi:hypothetical protein
MEPNAFNSTQVGAETGPLGVLAGAVGVVVVTVAFVADPLGRPVVAASWALLFTGVVLAVLPSRLRPVGKGLVFAGAAVPCAAFAFLWVVVSFGVLTGSIG